jgi:hypothetical protein
VVVSPLLCPESARLHEFSTPIKIRWRSLPRPYAHTHASPTDNAAHHHTTTANTTAIISTNANAKLTAKNTEAASEYTAAYDSPFRDVLLSHCISTMDFIAWTGCIPRYFDVAAAPVDSYCPEFDLKMGDLFIDFYGPPFATAQDPFKLQVSVTNSTHQVKVLRLEIIIRDENTLEPDRWVCRVMLT